MAKVETFLQPRWGIQVWEKIQEILLRDKPLSESIEIWEDLFLNLIVKDWGDNWQYVCFPFCWSWPEDEDILQVLAPLHTCIGRDLSKHFKQCPFCGRRLSFIKEKKIEKRL